MEILDLILTFFTTGILVKKSFIIMTAVYFYQMDDPDFIKIQIDGTLEQFPDIKHKTDVRNFVTSIFDDKFSLNSEVRKFRLNNHSLLFKLIELKEKILNFYFSTLSQLDETDSQNKLACDIHNTINNKVLQLKRLRMVVEPEIQVSQNIHPVSEIAYIAVKSFWINNDGLKTRDFTKSLGPLEEYGFKKYDKEKVSNDPKVIEKSLIRIQPVVYNRYKEYYPE